MADEDFNLPGLMHPVMLADAASLHIGGLDHYGIRYDAPDVFGNDPAIETDGPEDWKREQLPQFGPAFVRFTEERFNKLDALVQHLLARWSYQPTTVFGIASIQSTSAGGIAQATNGNGMIYEVPPGFTLAVHRLEIRDGGHTFGNPYTGAGGYWELRANDEMRDGGSLVSGTGSFPIVRTWGTRDAPHFRDGENVNFFMSGGPASTPVYIRLQGTLDRTIEG